jgi:hypothetical protein
VRIKTFVGTVRRNGPDEVFELRSATGKSLTLTCREGGVDVHPAGTISVPNPRSHECGDRDGLLRPARTQPVDVLKCRGGVDESVYSAAEVYAEAATFAPAPGVEEIRFMNHCDYAIGYRFPGTAD